MIRPMRDTAIIPNEIQTYFRPGCQIPAHQSLQRGRQTAWLKTARTEMQTTGIFSKAPFCCLQKQRFFSMFHTSDNTPLHLVFRADMRLPHIPVEGAGFQQFLMRTLCVDGSILHNNDVVRADNGRQSVCNHNQGLADS